MGRMSGRLVMVIAVVIVGLCVVAVAALWTFQRSFVFVPNASPVGAAGDSFAGGQDLTLRTEDGVTLEAWLLPAEPSTDRDAAVLYAPGNAGNRESRLGIARDLTERGFTVLLLEYRGYGGNPGTPTATGLAHDAVAAVNALVAEGFAPERTLYLGESIGTGVVARLQSTDPPAGVLLRSPFPDFAAVAGEHYPLLPTGLMLRDRFPVLEYVSDSQVPITVLYGSADTIVPPSFSSEVAENVHNLHEKIVLESVGHNDPEMFGAPVGEALERLADHVLR